MVAVAQILLILQVLSGSATTGIYETEIENTEGVVINVEIVSVIRSEQKNQSWLCFRKPKDPHLYLYPFTSLSTSSLERLSAFYSDKSGLVVVNNATGPQLDVLTKYLKAGPRERLVIELREKRKIERLLEREWKRLQDQTWELQKNLAAAKTAEQRQLIGPLFQTSLRARDRTGKQLVLVQRDIRVLLERIALLRSMGVEIEDNPFEE
jgi:hypothetical protein